MIFVPPFGGYNKKIFWLASLAVICTPRLCKRCAAPAFIVTLRESNINIELLLFPEGFITADRRSTARIIVLINRCGQ